MPVDVAEGEGVVVFWGFGEIEAAGCGVVTVAGGEERTDVWEGEDNVV